MSQFKWVESIPMFDLVPDQFQTVSEYAEHQRARLLYIIQGITALVAAPLAVIYRYTQYKAISYSLFGMILMSLIGMLINYKGRAKIASILLLFSLYVVAIIAMADGDGLRSPGTTIFPALIIFTSLLFSKESTITITAIIIASIVGFDVLEKMGVFLPDESVPWDFVFSLSVMNAGIAVVQYSLILFWERNFSWAQRSAERVYEAYEKTLEGWAKALEYRDYETAGHSRRVVGLSLAFAKKIGITDPDSLSSIRIGALMHDIGKLAIPAHILEKDGPLDEEEWEEVKRHPLLAREMLEDLPFHKSVLDIPFYHHERWDGAGYPHGLAGEEIPQAARMFALVDNWDALRHDRPYRSSWSRTEAIKYIQENSGELFDPALVPPFVELVENADSE